MGHKQNPKTQQFQLPLKTAHAVPYWQVESGKEPAPTVTLRVRYVVASAVARRCVKCHTHAHRIRSGKTARKRWSGEKRRALEPTQHLNPFEAEEVEEAEDQARDRKLTLDRGLKGIIAKVQHEGA